ncbi:MAG: thermonuclease family protein [Patescibacteria group bacterium]
MSHRGLFILSAIFALSFACHVFVLLSGGSVQSQKEIVPISRVSDSDAVFPAELVRVVDGDTYILNIHIWEDVVLSKRIRLLGVDTPELHPRRGSVEEKLSEKELAARASEFALERLSGKNLFFVYSWKSDSFGRALGTVIWFEGDVRYDIREELSKYGLLKTSVGETSMRLFSSECIADIEEIKGMSFGMFKFVRVDGRYVFADLDVCHRDMIGKEEKALSAGLIRFKNGRFCYDALSSITLGVSVDSGDNERLEQLLGFRAVASWEI